MPQLTLTYFDAPGRAEPIRVALRMAGVAFEDRRLSFPEFGAAKAGGELPLAQVPMLQVDTERVVQTGAILRYAAGLGGGALYPSDPLLALRVDSALATINDTLSHALTPSLWERDPEVKLQMRRDFAAGPMARAYGYLAGLIAASGGPFVAGASLSIADLVIALQVEQIRSGSLDGLSAADIEPFSRIGALADACLADPLVVAARQG